MWVDLCIAEGRRTRGRGRLRRAGPRPLRSGPGRRRKRSFSSTADPRVEAAPDRVDRKFAASAPNQLWVTDVTYVPTVQGWLYLAYITDVFSRMVIGRSTASHRKTDLVVDAVDMAVHRRGGHIPGVIHHSDRGGVQLPRPGAGAAPARRAGQHGQRCGPLR